MRWQMLRAAVGTALALLLSTASAAPLHYNEAVSGDITGSPTFNLDVGTNTVEGIFGLVLRVEPPGRPVIVFVDLDAFNFTIPVGTELVAATISPILIDATPNTTVFGINSFLIYAGGTRSNDECFNLLGTHPGCQDLISGPGDLGGSVLPLSDLSYRLDTGFIVFGADETLNHGGIVDYLIELVVAPAATVPEPASVMLAGLILAGLAVQRRRRSLSAPALSG